MSLPWQKHQPNNGKKCQRDPKNHSGQTRHGCQRILHDGTPSSNNPPNIQSHGHQVSHGYKSQSQSYPHCSGSTAMHSQAESVYGLPPGQEEAYMPQSMDYTHPGEPAQVCAQESLYRSVQASTQMLYDVFDYTIGMLEELEKHEGHPGKYVLPNSGIFPHLVPLNHKKPVPEVIAGIETQLQCLSIQMRYLPKDVINDDSRRKMVEQTLEWLAAREELQVPCSEVEWYCKNILEIVLLAHPGEMLPKEHPPPSKMNSEQVNEAMFQMARARDFGEQQDKQFHEDPNKKAKLKPKRRAQKKVSLREGANRLPKHNMDKTLIEALGKYVPDLDATLK